jgi:calcineurin-like phosphoesterase family protein
MGIKRWVIADLHLDHKNIILLANRPFTSLEEMQNELIKRWNNIVKKDDLVYVLGDFMLSRHKELLKEKLNLLNGHKILIMGNHDTLKPKDYIEAGFIQATRKPILVEPRVILMHEPPDETNIVDGMFYIFGHVHNKLCSADKHNNCKCVSVERINYTPIDLDTLINTFIQTL